MPGGEGMTPDAAAQREWLRQWNDAGPAPAVFPAFPGLDLSPPAYYKYVRFEH